MGEMADALINGEMCAQCGAYLEPGETVFLQCDQEIEMEMPEDGEGMGFPVVCAMCHE